MAQAGRAGAALLAAFLLGGVGAAEAGAAPGELTQKPGPDGCVWQAGLSGCAFGTALDGALAVAVSPDGRSAYVASDASGAVAVFARNTDGKLTQTGCISETGASPCGAGTALAGARSVAVSPDGKNVYVASSNRDAVAVFDRAADGTLTQTDCISDTVFADCTDGEVLDGANSVTVSADGRSVYVASYFSDAVAVFDREADGKLTQKQGAAGCISQTGAEPCAGGTALDGAFSVTVSADGGSAYLASFFSDAVAVFDRAADGTLAQKQGAAGCISHTGADPCAGGTALDAAASVAVSPDGGSAYVASSNSDAVAVFDRAANGTLTQTGCVSETEGACGAGTALDGATSVAVSPDGASAYVASFDGDAVAVLDRAADGTLTQKPGAAGCISEETGAAPCADGTALDSAISVAVSPDGTSAYVAATTSDAVAVFDRELPPPPAPVSPAPVPVPSAPSPAPSAAPAPAGTTGLLLSELSLSPRRFRAAARGASIARRVRRRVRRRVGSRASYTLSEPAAVRFRVERALAGRRVGGRCVKPTRSNRRARRCTRFRTLRGGFTHRGKAGRNKFRFTGRLRGRKLRPGRYRLRAVATDPAGNKSRPQRTRFRIVPKRRTRGRGTGA